MLVVACKIVLHILEGCIPVAAVCFPANLVCRRVVVEGHAPLIVRFSVEVAAPVLLFHCGVVMLGHCFAAKGADDRTYCCTNDCSHGTNSQRPRSSTGGYTTGSSADPYSNRMRAGRPGDWVAIRRRLVRVESVHVCLRLCR